MIINFEGMDSFLMEDEEHNSDETPQEIESRTFNFFDTIKKSDLISELNNHHIFPSVEVRQPRENEQYFQTSASISVCCVITQFFNDEDELVKSKYTPILTILKDEPVNVSTYNVDFSPCRSLDGTRFIRPTIIADDEPWSGFLPSLEASIGGEIIDSPEHDIISELSNQYDQHHGANLYGVPIYQHVRPLSI